jgi:phosphate/phosphite/phosphonate ABC transporter binding protein
MEPFLAMSFEKPLVFGCVLRSARAGTARIVADVAQEVGIDIEMEEASSYEDLAQAVQIGDVDLAWLPPIAFIALDRQKLVSPLVSSARGGGLAFESVIIVNKKSRYLRLRELAGARAAWVDPYSASGYVFPRVELAAAGVDLSAFASETFYASHADVVRAVAMGHADFGATFATLGPKGEVVRSAWKDSREASQSIRVLASLGSLPADLIAARYTVPAALQTRLTRAFIAVSREPANRLLLLEAFGADELKAAKPRGYDVLRAETERAAATGLL